MFRKLMIGATAFTCTFVLIAASASESGLIA